MTVPFPQSILCLQQSYAFWLQRKKHFPLYSLIYSAVISVCVCVHARRITVFREAQMKPIRTILSEQILFRRNRFAQIFRSEDLLSAKDQNTNKFNSRLSIHFSNYSLKFLRVFFYISWYLIVISIYHLTTKTKDEEHHSYRSVDSDACNTVIQDVICLFIQEYVAYQCCRWKGSLWKSTWRVLVPCKAKRHGSGNCLLDVVSLSWFGSVCLLGQINLSLYRARMAQIAFLWVSFSYWTKIIFVTPYISLPFVLEVSAWSQLNFIQSLPYEQWLLRWTPPKWSLHDVVANVLGCNIVVSEFEF